MRTYIKIVNPETGLIYVGFSESEDEPNTYTLDNQIPPFTDDNGARKVVSALNYQMRTTISSITAST